MSILALYLRYKRCWELIKNTNYFDIDENNLEKFSYINFRFWKIEDKIKILINTSNLWAEEISEGKKNEK